jgi:enamine deaminase RidA (YjgF/YER057c/UK114 family)
MTITRIGTERRRMSKIVIHNDTVYLCGQVAKDSDADIKEQTRTMLEKVDDLLIQAGSDREHILSATVYICHRLHQRHEILCRNERSLGCMGL